MNPAPTQTPAPKRSPAVMLAFDQFLELVPDAIVISDASGEIVSINGQAERLFGYERTELLGKRVEVLLPEQFAKSHTKQRDGYFDDPRPRPIGLGLGLSGKRKDGTTFPADISLSSIDTAAGTVAAAAVRDLTERFEDEQERRALEAEAREARSQRTSRLESIGELAGGIAHDFNNLLAVVLNNAELAVLKAEKGAEHSDELREIQGAAEHGSKLTRQLLVFSRRQVVAREPVDLNSVISGMERILRGSIGEQIELQINLDSDLPTVMAESTQIEQVVLNLSINARDAMKSGGKLEIGTKVVELDEAYARTRPDVTPGQYVRLTIADDGVGMPREVVTRAFEPFFTTKPKGEGTGLGLATVYGIVRQFEGDINIYSEEGGGTVIRVHLPITGDTADVAQAATEAVADPAHGQRILVVEDADAVRRSVCEILRMHGYAVVEANRGQKALEILADGGVDLILTDLVMPEMHGNELAAEVRESDPDLPIVFMSGYTDVPGPIEDASMLIQKPFTSATLLSKLQEALAANNGGK